VKSARNNKQIILTQNGKSMETMVDKSKELNTSINLINDKLNFKGIVAGNIPVSIDYTSPLGDNSGYTSLELLLLSLSSCIGSAILTFLRKMKKTIKGCEIHSKGIRKEEHPTGFKTIIITINLKSADTTADDFNKVVKLSEETYCPVWSMLKGNVEIEIKHNISA
jgi:putative redox protein